MKFLTTNLVSEAATTIAASSSDVNFPASNLKHPFRSKRWRTTDNVSESVTFDFQTTEPVDSVVILWPKEDGIKLTPSAVIRIQANATNVWTSPAVDQVVSIDNTYSVASHFFSTDQNYRYWRLVVQDPLNAYTYIEIGMIWIGKSLSIPNAQNGFKFSLVDNTKSTRTDFGHKYSDEYPQSSVVDISYKYLSYSQVQILENAFRTNGSSDPVIVALDPEEAVFDKDHYLVYGTMSPKFSTSHVFYNVLDVPDITVEELS